MNRVQRKILSQLGPIYMVASEKVLFGISFEMEDVPREKKNSLESKFLDRVEDQIREYLDGKRSTFDITLELEGTEFQKKVWSQLQKIPYGQTRSYKEIAVALKNPQACRAVGTANGRNPISLIVPCHRVINQGGSIGGYAGGVSIKEKLLNLEKDRSL